MIDRIKLNKPEPRSFPAAMREFFGLLEGEGVGGFLQELKALDESDRAWFREELSRSGHPVADKKEA